MKARTVLIGLEILTDLPISKLRDKKTWERGARFDQLLDACTAQAWEIEQVQVNVARGTAVKATKVRRKKKGH